jgi:phosphate transport system substrate-binding protein
MAHCAPRWLSQLILSVLTCLSGAVAAANPVDSAEGARAATPKSLRLAAAVTLAPMANDLVAELRKRGGRAVPPNIVGSETALEALLDRSADIALISRPLSAKEAQRLQGKVIGHDSVLLVVHERNPLEQIDMATVRAIFSREVSDWQQVGAGNSGAIVPVTRSLAHGTRSFFDAAFGIGRVVPAGIVELSSNLAAVLYVAADPQAIGYVSAGAYDLARLRGLRIKALRMEGLTPGAQFCVGARYPLCRPLLLVQRKDMAATRETVLLDTLLSGKGGAALLESHRFAPAAP